ncbi:hypothetical protein D9M70_568840 [compost metagenome]
MPKVVGQAVFGVTSLLDFGSDVFKLLVCNFDQHTDLIVFMARRVLQPGRFDAARIAAAEFADDSHQRFGQHHVEQRQQDAGQEQAAGEPIEQGDFGPAQEPVAK